jgi:hypothetical protein
MKKPAGVTRRPLKKPAGVAKRPRLRADRGIRRKVQKKPAGSRVSRATQWRHEAKVQKNSNKQKRSRNNVVARARKAAGDKKAYSPADPKFNKLAKGVHEAKTMAMNSMSQSEHATSIAEDAKSTANTANERSEKTERLQDSTNIRVENAAMLLRHLTARVNAGDLREAVTGNTLQRHTTHLKDLNTRTNWIWRMDEDGNSLNPYRGTEVAGPGNGFAGNSLIPYRGTEVAVSEPAIAGY